MANYFISDTHFGHKNVLAYDNRPFKNTDEHDIGLVNNWNEAVNIDDDVYILGDISWYNVTKTIGIIKQLNGNKHLIIGNHDHRFLKNKDFRDCFVEIEHYKELDLNNGKKLILCHYPIPCFNNRYSGNYHFYGHVHKGFEENMMQRVKYELEDLYPDKPCQMYNVGAMIDYMYFTPRTFEEVINRSQKRWYNGMECEEIGEIKTVLL